MRERRLIEKMRIDSKFTEYDWRMEQVFSIIYGFVIGDCLGVPVEFMKRGSFKINDMIGYGTYKQPKGTWSDDTSLTLATIEHIVSKEKDMDSLMKIFVKYKAGYLTPYGKMFDIGITTDLAINRFSQGYKASECGGTGERDNGNGALMRIAPLALILQDEENFNDKIEMIKKYTEITHAHPRSIVGSIIYIDLLISVLFKCSVKEAIKKIKTSFEMNFEKDSEYMHEFNNSYSRIFDESFFDFDSKEIKSSGYVVDTLEAAIWCAGTTDNYKDAVLKAVNLGEDTDTIGAIAGSIAGAIYKYESISSEWLGTIASNEVIYDKCVNLADYILLNTTKEASEI